MLGVRIGESRGIVRWDVSKDTSCGVGVWVGNSILDFFKRVELSTKSSNGLTGVGVNETLIVFYCRAREWLFWSNNIKLASCKDVESPSASTISTVFTDARSEAV